MLKTSGKHDKWSYAHCMSYPMHWSTAELTILSWRWAWDSSLRDALCVLYKPCWPHKKQSRNCVEKANAYQGGYHQILRRWTHWQALKAHSTPIMLAFHLLSWFPQQGYPTLLSNPLSSWDSLVKTTEWYQHSSPALKKSDLLKRFDNSVYGAQQVESGKGKDSRSRDQWHKPWACLSVTRLVMYSCRLLQTCRFWVMLTAHLLCYKAA